MHESGTEAKTYARLCQAVFDTVGKKGKGGKFRDSEFYMSHYQKDADTEKGYVVSVRVPVCRRLTAPR